MCAQSDVPDHNVIYPLNSSDWEAFDDFYSLMPDQWRAWVTGQTVVIAIMFVAVTCSCLYGLLTGPPGYRLPRGELTPERSTRAPSGNGVGYARLSSRESSVDDTRLETPRPQSEARDEFRDSLMFLWWLRVE